MGQAWGLANQLVLLVACVAMVLLVISAAVMWWKRRPAKAIGIPQMPADWRIPRTLLLLAVVAGLFFPLAGLTMLLIAAVETALHLMRKRHRQPA